MSSSYPILKPKSDKLNSEHYTCYLILGLPCIRMYTYSTYAFYLLVYPPPSAVDIQYTFINLRYDNVNNDNDDGGDNNNYINRGLI